MLGGPGEQHKQQQRTGQQHVDVGHHTHAFVDARDGHQNGRAHHQGDQAHLNPLGMRYAEQVVEAGVEVQHPKAHVGPQTKHRGDDAEAVHRIADRPVNALADQRVQRRTQRQRQVVPVSEVGQRHADKGKHTPAVQAPVQKQQLHGLTCGRISTCRALRRGEHMGEGF